MKSPRRLKTIEKIYIRSMSRFTKDLANVGTSANNHVMEKSISYAAINMLNCWANFNRMYFASCAQGAVSPSGGHIVSDLSGTGATFNDLIGKAINHYKPNATPRANGMWDTRDEPTWHDSATILKLAQVFNFSNINDINAAFTFGYTAHRNLAVFRNYYGHKNMGTMRKAQTLASAYSIQSNLSPSQILLRPPSGSTQALLTVWRTELCDTISYLCS